MEYWWLVLGKPPAYSSARLGHIPSLPWESQLPLKPCLSLQPSDFKGNCDFSDSLLDFCCHCAVLLFASQMWATRPHLGSIFEKLLHRKTFCLPAAHHWKQCTQKLDSQFPCSFLMTILRHRFLNLSVYNQFRCFSCLLKRLLHGFLIALWKLPQNPIC